MLYNQMNERNRALKLHRKRYSKENGTFWMEQIPNKSAHVEKKNKEYLYTQFSITSSVCIALVCTHKLQSLIKISHLINLDIAYTVNVWFVNQCIYMSQMDRWPRFSAQCINKHDNLVLVHIPIRRSYNNFQRQLGLRSEWYLDILNT